MGTTVFEQYHFWGSPPPTKLVTFENLEIITLISRILQIWVENLVLLIKKNKKTSLNHQRLCFAAITVVHFEI